MDSLEFVPENTDRIQPRYRAARYLDEWGRRERNLQLMLEELKVHCHGIDGLDRHRVYPFSALPP